LLQIVFKVGHLYRTGKFVTNCPDDKLILAFIFSSGQGVDGGHYGRIESFITQALKSPAAALFDDVVQVGDDPLVVPLDDPSDALAVRKYGFPSLSVWPA
jgi:hypothetical protein